MKYLSQHLIKRIDLKPAWLLSLLILTSTIRLQAQNTVYDSLSALLKNTTSDTGKLFLFVQLTEQCELNEILKYAEPAVELADKLLTGKINSKLNLKILGQKALALNNIGVVNKYQGDIPKSLNYFDKSLKIQEEIGDKEGVAASLNNIGLLYYELGDILKALNYYERSLKIKEEIGDKKNIPISINNIGFIYYIQGEYDKALEYYNKSLELYEKIDDKTGIAMSFNNIGMIYHSKHHDEKALDYYNRSLKIQEETGDKKGIANSLINLGFLYRNHGEIQKAMNYYQRSLKIYKELGHKQGLTTSLNSLGAAYFKLALEPELLSAKQKNLQFAFFYSDSSLALSKQLGFPELIRNACLTLSDIEIHRGKPKQAFEHYKQYILFRDSLNNEQTRKASIKNQLKYEYDKKEAIIKEQQEKERAVVREKNRFQQIVIVSVVLGFILVLVFAAFVFRSLKITRKQKIIIEEKQKEILDSIHYAKKIQTALMTNENYIEKSLKKLRTDKINSFP